MKPGITKREKTLLFSVGLVALVYFAIQFLIIPLSTRYNGGIIEREDLTSEKALHQVEVATLPELRERNAEAHEKFMTLTEGYPDFMSNDEVDYMLTNLCNNHLLKPSSLRFAPRETPKPPPPPEYDEDGNLIEKDPQTIPTGPVFSSVSARMNVTGSYQSLLRLIDEVNSIKYIRLSNIGFSPSSQADMEDSASIPLTFEVTFLSQ